MVGSGADKLPAFNALKKNCYAILMGDFNIDMLSTENNRRNNLFDSYGFTQLIKEPTRVTDKTATLLDHILVSHTDFVQEVTCVSSVTMSDHYPAGVTWQMKNKRQSHGHNMISYRQRHNLDYDIISTNIFNILNNELNLKSDLNEQVNLLGK